MEDEKKDLQDPKLADDQTSKNETEAESSNEDMAKELASFKAQKEHFRTKYQKAQELLDTLDEKEPTKEVKSNVPDNDRLDIIDFSVIHRDLDRDDVLKINKYAKSLGITMEQALEDDFVKAGLEKKTKDRASEEAKFDSNRSPRSKSGKKIEYYNGMPDAEFKKAAGY